MLYKAGLARRGFNGPESLSWQDLVHFSQATRLEITGHEMEIIRELSAVYVSTLEQAKDPNMKPPYSAPVSVADRVKHMKAQSRG